MDLGKIDALFAPFTDVNRPGWAVAVMEKGELIYAKGFGCANLTTGEPITPETVFHVASVSKQFTAFCITLLEEEGKLSVDDCVRKYLPGLPEHMNDVKIRHLLSHLGGLREHWDLFTLTGHSMEDLVTRDLMWRLTANQPDKSFTPGERHSYCNSGYFLLSEIVRAVSGRTLREFADERIFKPLGMDHTLIRDRHGEVVPGRALSYRMTDRGWEEYALTFDLVGPTSLNTTVLDLCKWLKNWREPKIAGRAVLDRMTAPVYFNDGSLCFYRRGLRMRMHRGVENRQHTGVNAGYRAIVLTEGDYDIVIIGNLEDAEPCNRAYAILDILKDQGTEPEGLAYRKEEKLCPTEGNYRSDFGFVRMKREGEDIRIGKRALYRHLRGNEYYRPETLVWLHTLEDGFVISAAGQDTVYTPLITEAVSEASGKELTGTWYCRGLELFYRVRTEEGKLILSDLRSGSMCFEQVGENRFFETDRSGKTLEYRDGALYLSTERTRNLKFVRMPEGLL